jgi:predicted nucleic acid-binding protein
MPDVICNTSPIQYLHQVNLLHILRELYGLIAIPEGVLAELHAGLMMGISLPDVKSLSWFSVKYVRERNLLKMVSGLGAGEKEVLGLALETPGSLVILDDLPARRYASFLGVRLTGTLGLLLKAKEKGIIDAVLPVLDQLEALQFRLDPKTRRAVLKLARETV